MKRFILLLALISFCHTEQSCSDFNALLITGCQSTTPSTGTCSYYGDKCLPTYSSCSAYAPETGFDDKICQSIVSNTPRKKCGVITKEGKKTCGEIDKTCEELTTKDDCKALETEENSRCLFVSNTKCQLNYDECTNAKLNTKEKCEANIPKENTKYCSWDNGSCKSSDRKCENYIVYEGKDGETSLACGDIAVTGQKKCVTYETTCYYEDCKGFSETECSNIKPFDATGGFNHKKKCAYDSECKSVDKNCADYEKDYDDGLVCVQLKTTDDTKKKCLYNSNNDACSEIYKTCEIYETEVADITKRSKEECEKITPEYTAAEKPYKYKCVFDSAEDKKTCKEEKKVCEDYTGTDEALCAELTVNIVGDELDKMECKIVGGKCIKQYKDCATYNAIVGTKDKTICESIKLSEEFKKCVLKEGVCSDEVKSCSEYSGKDQSQCVQYGKFEASENKVCTIIDDKCTEKTIYKKCEDYKGTNKNECESISPYKTDADEIDPTSKCVYSTTDGCKKQPKECGDAKSASDCSSITPTSDPPYKQCAYVNNACVEQYKTCKIYYDRVDQIDKDVCESIVINDETAGSTITSTTHRCRYLAVTGGRNKCEAVPRECSDFTAEKIKDQCTSIIPSADISKKCVFENNSCAEKSKTCLDLSTVTVGAKDNLDDICSKAATSSAEKECKAKSDKSGCEEKVIPPTELKEDTSETTTGQESNPAQQEKNSSKYNYVTNIFFIAVCLLF